MIKGNRMKKNIDQNRNSKIIGMGEGNERKKEILGGN